MEKPLFWLGSSRSDIRALPVRARRAAGFQLLRVQQGLDPADWKPMASVGAGVTAKKDIELARERYKDLVERQRKGNHAKG